MSATRPGWSVRAGVGLPSRRMGNGTVTEDADRVELRVDRGLHSGKLDLVPLTEAEAIDLATDLLDAVRLLAVRRQNRARS